jgi:hypothetical protein
MAHHAAIALSLAALAWTGSAEAQDNPACAKYSEPMAYNLCLAQHGPKANSIGKLRGPLPSQAGQDRVGYRHMRGHAPAARSYSPQGARRIHGRMHMEFPVR